MLQFGEASKAKGVLSPLLRPPKKDSEPFTVIHYVYDYGRSSVLSEESVFNQMQSISIQVAQTFANFGGIAATITSPYRSQALGIHDLKVNENIELFQVAEVQDEPKFIDDSYFDSMSNLLRREPIGRLDLSASSGGVADLYTVSLEED
jgi:hypothetical protein